VDASRARLQGWPKPARQSESSAALAVVAETEEASASSLLVADEEEAPGLKNLLSSEGDGRWSRALGTGDSCGPGSDV